eukprot:gene17410-biopygen3855
MTILFKYALGPGRPSRFLLLSSRCTPPPAQILCGGLRVCVVCKRSHQRRLDLRRARPMKKRTPRFAPCAGQDLQFTCCRQGGEVFNGVKASVQQYFRSKAQEYPRNQHYPIPSSGTISNSKSLMLETTAQQPDISRGQQVRVRGKTSF